MRALGYFLTASISVLLSGPAGAESFRVTGVFGTAGDLAAMIESAAGYRIVREGDGLDGGSVVEVLPQGIRLARDGEVTLIPLSGVEGQNSAGAAETTKIDLPPRRQAVAELRRVARTLSGNGEQDWPQVARALKLPEGSVLTEVDRQPVEGPKEALQQVHEALARGEIPSITIDGPEQEMRVYVIPQDAGVSTETEGAAE